MEDTPLQHPGGISRRGLISAALGLGAAATLARTGGWTRPEPARAQTRGLRHLVWVWQFSTDAEPHHIGARLRDNGLGIVMKTHDGVSWMNEYDSSRYAVSGGPQVATLVKYFEDGGVPVHAWCVVKGDDPLREARMAAEVLASGARSLWLDIEPHAGFWRGSPRDALSFGSELRRLQPNAHVILSLDPRPWLLTRLPLNEFLSFSNEIAPQNYWRTFDTPANYARFTESGFPVGPGGMTPEFLIDVTNRTLSGYGLPITHVGQGATPEPEEWRRFIDGAYNGGSQIVTVWRFGVTNNGVFGVLKGIPPRMPVTPSGIGVRGVYVVQPGDTLGAIARVNGTTVDDLVALNGLSDANYLYVGQELRLPGGAVAGAVASVPAAAATSGATRSYTVEDGDTLSRIAGRFGTDVDSLVRLNALADPDYLFIGQRLVVPA